MKKRLLFTLLFLFVLTESMATHIVGGEILYEHLGGASYRLTMKLYRDCDPTSVDFPGTVRIYAKNGDGTDVLDGATLGIDFFDLVIQDRDTLDPPIDTCAFDPGLCLEEAIYSEVVSLPPNPGGYHLYHTTWARNDEIINLTSPLTTGEAFYAYVPDNGLYLTNSSPVFSNFPPVFVCLGQDLATDFSATDIDGDSLVYSFYQPYDGRPDWHPDYAIYEPTFAGLPPDNITFVNVTYADPSYSATNPLNPAPPTSGTPISIDPNTGFISGIPEQIGQHVVGVMIEEYRDGDKIGEIVRDFQFNVLVCPPPQDALIGELDGCAGSTVDFVNNSGAGATGFWWDFGTGIPADTSILAEPSFTYPLGPATYTVTLIAQKGTNCADTTTYELTLSDLTADWSGPDTLCLNELGNFFDLSIAEINGVVDSWEWDFGDGSTSTDQDPTHAYTSGGDYDVELIVGTDVGCIDTLEVPLHVEIPPAAGITSVVVCNSLDVDFINNSDPEASGFWWNFGTGDPADTSLATNPSFTYTSYGSYTVTLVAQKGTACADTATFALMVSNVVADFDDVDTTCTNVLIDFNDMSTNVGGTINSWQWDFGDGSSSTDEDPSHGYTTSGDYVVELIVGSDLGCSDTITKNLHIKDPPTPDIGPIDNCSGLTITFQNLSDTDADGFWWNFGTGVAADTSIAFEPTFTFPGYGTFTVDLVAQKGTSCETFTSETFTISELIADYVYTDTVCSNEATDFFDASSALAGTTIINWEWDFSDGTLSGFPNPTHTFSTSSGDIPVQLVITSDIGCTDTVEYDIHVQTAPVVDAGLDTAVCLASPSLELSGLITAAGGGEWSGNGGVFVPSVTDLNATYFPSLVELTAGSTFLVLTSTGNGNCEAVTDTLNILYLDNPEIDAGGNIDVCEDSTYVVIDATVLFSTNVTWNTFGDGSFDDDGVLDATYNFGPGDIAAGSITLYVDTYNFSGCPDDSDTLTISINEPPTMVPMNDTIICTGFPLVLDAQSSTGAGNWLTSGTGSFDPDSTSLTTYTPSNADNIIGSVTIGFESANNGGCPAMYDTLLVTIIPSPTPDFEFTENCFGIPSVFTNNSSSDSPVTSYEWTFEPGITSTDTDPTHTFTTPGIYPVQLVVFATNGCADTLTQNVETFFLPAPEFVIPEPCVDGGTYFIDSSSVGNADIVSWEWNFGDGTGVDTSANPVHQFSGSGDYSITLTLTSDKGCTNDTVVVVNILPGPDAAFIVDPPSANLFVDLNFTDQSVPDGSPLSTWLWLFADGDSANTQNAVHQYDFEGEYDVLLIVTDEAGCVDTANVIVPIYHGPLVPSAFSPNGDGENDFLMILGGNYEEIDFKVYNNWGEIVYNTTDPDALGWDGTHKGQDQPIGVYVYVATVITYDGQEHVLSGDVSLIR